MSGTEIKTKPFFFRINPLSKLVALILIIIADIIFIFTSPLKIIVVILVLLLTIQLSGNKFLHILKNSIRFYPMIFFLTMLLPFSGSGEVIGQIFAQKIYRIGLEKFLYHNIFMIIVLIYSNLFITTTPIIEVIGWLGKLNVPKKLLSILFLVNRLLSVMKTDIIKKTNAFKSRHLKLSAKNTLNYSAKFLISLFEDFILKNEKIYFALAARNFRGEITVRSKLEWNTYDYHFLLVLTIILAFLIWI